MDKVLAAEPLKVPLMLVHSIWDQEDIYGAPAVYKALKPKDTGNDMVYMVLGPWHHGQEIDDGNRLGPIKFNSNTASYFRQEILVPFLAQYLKDGAPKANVPIVSAFETGTNRWLRLPTWPTGCPDGCKITPTPLHLGDSMTAGFTAPAEGAKEFDEYVSDPAKPVLYLSRPVPYNDPRWSSWLVTDQRDASSRPDVLTFTSERLNETRTTFASTLLVLCTQDGENAQDDLAPTSSTSHASPAFLNVSWHLCRVPAALQGGQDEDQIHHPHNLSPFLRF